MASKAFQTEVVPAWVRKKRTELLDELGRQSRENLLADLRIYRKWKDKKKKASVF